MTTLTLPEPRTDLAGARITAAGLLRSEWTKLRSLRSLRVTLAAAFALVLGLSGYVVLEGTALDGAPADIPFSFTAVYPIGTLALVVLGVLAVTSEYSSGTVRVSMVAAPRRAGVLLAKAVVLTAVTAGLAVVSSVLLYLLVQVTGTLPAARGVSLLDPEMLGGVLANTLLLPYGALFGVVLGALVRDAAGAITLYFGVFQLGPQIFPAFLPEPVAGVVDVLPTVAMNVVRAAGLSSEPYGVGTAVLVLVAWVGALGAAAWWRLRRQDV